MRFRLYGPGSFGGARTFSLSFPVTFVSLSRLLAEMLLHSPVLCLYFARVRVGAGVYVCMRMLVVCACMGVGVSACA